MNRKEGIVARYVAKFKTKQRPRCAQSVPHAVNQGNLKLLLKMEKKWSQKQTVFRHS